MGAAGARSVASGWRGECRGSDVERVNVGVAALGHAHPKLAAALAEQATELVHTSSLFFHPLQAEVARTNVEDRLRAILEGLLDDQ